jgi:hypothetical protein
LLVLQTFKIIDIFENVTRKESDFKHIFEGSYDEIIEEGPT